MTTLPLFYGFDTGTGTAVVDVTGNVTMVSANLPSNITGPYGRSLSWDNALGNPGIRMNGESTSAINTATSLKDLGTGAGWTYALTFYPTGPSFASGGGLPFGRPAHAAEGAPFTNWLFQMNNSSDPLTIFGSVNNNGASVTLGIFTLPGFNTLVSAVMVAKNDSAGSATVKTYINGVQIDSTSGLAVASTSQPSDTEEQLNFGVIFHPDTGLNANNFTGQCFQGLFIPAPWTPTQVALFNSQPYDGLTF